MTHDPALLSPAILERLERAEQGGLRESILLGSVMKAIPGATKEEIRAALQELRAAGQVQPEGPRWRRIFPPTVAPVDPQALLDMEGTGLRLRSLSLTLIEVEVETPEPVVDPEAKAADEATFQANLAAATAGQPVGDEGRVSLDLTDDLLQRLLQGVGPLPARPLPSRAQVRAVAWLVEHEREVVDALADIMPGGRNPGRRPKPGRPELEQRDEFGVDVVLVRSEASGRPMLELRGWCGWDPEHGFSLDLG